MSDFKKILGYVGCAGVVVVMAVFAATWIGFHRGDPTRYTQGTVGLCSNVPEPYKTIFDKAGQKWKVQPAFIAAIFVGEHRSVADSSYKKWPDANQTNWDSSGVGAQGPFQFMPATWESNKQDGNGDGTMDVQNLWDAAFSAAHKLAMSGAGGNTTDIDKLKDVAGQYNGGHDWQGKTESQKYVARVIPAFNNFYCVSLAGSGNIVAVAKTELGTQEVGDDKGAVLKYGGNPGDAWCAYFASWVYKKAGYNIPSIAGAKALYDWFGKYQISFTRESGTPQPGDLVYFKKSHVGIVVSLDSNGTLHTIEGNAGHPGAVREETYHNYKSINDIEGFGRWRK
ncbi:MAG: CHAP domain-containing protein [Patescibacteria group bacterium]|nr:CHAP domain-containing protein [Patescibacteria group bacterium]